MEWLKINSNTYNKIQYSGNGKIVFYFLSPKPFVSINDDDNNYDYEVIPVKVDKKLCLYDLKQLVLKLQKEYDKSDDVNYFIFNGKKYWFDKETRVGLVNSLNVQQSVGQTNTILWFDDISVNVSIVYVKEFLKNLELYAIECFNVTQNHIIEINALKDMDDMFNYNVTTGYPEPIEFDVNEVIE